MGMKVKGMKEARDGFRALGRELPNAIDDGVNKHTDGVFDETQARVPRKTNALAETGRVEKEDTRRTLSVHKIIYGEPGEGEGVVDYAAAVHEILGARHDAPTGPKYVEQPLVESILEAEKTLAKSAKDAVKEAFK